MTKDAVVAAMLAAELDEPFEDLLETLLKVPLPEAWGTWSIERAFEYLRCRLRFTQAELAQKAGLTQPGVSKMEGGGDALLSSWRKAYAAMGFDLVLLPVSRLSVAELKERSEEGRPGAHWLRERCRPRRRRMREEEGKRRRRAP